MDKVLEALYDTDRKAGLGSSAPNVNRWLGDIRRYFPTPVVQLLQRDALHRLGQLADARAAYERILELAPGDGDATTYRVTIVYRLER